MKGYRITIEFEVDDDVTDDDAQRIAINAEVQVGDAVILGDDGNERRIPTTVFFSRLESC